ncbi:MAG: hypothetical protein ACPGQ5_06060 [Alphaproteobacteria bacterium]
MSRKLLNPKIAALLAATAALAACTGVTVSRVDHAIQYNPFEAAAAGGGDRQMRVVVLGNPFDTPQAELEGAVIAAMQDTNFGVPLNFALDPANPDTSRPFRVVMAFNPDGLRDPGKLCEATDVKTASPTDGRVTLMAAFCSKESYLSHAIARAGDVGGTGSKTFGDMIFQLTASLFPSRNPNDQSAGEPPLPAT